MGENNNSDLKSNIDLGDAYPNRAKEERISDNMKRVSAIRQAQDARDPQMAPVYAGPAFMNAQAQNPQPLPPMTSAMMIVYAGPDVMSGRNIIPYNNSDNTQVSPDAVICSVCGAPNRKGAKFCVNCGSVLEK